MFRFCIALTGTLHDRTVRSSTITVHAPHCDRPQPNLGPFSPKLSRKRYKSGVLGSTSTTRALPLTVRVIRDIATTSIFRCSNPEIPAVFFSSSLASYFKFLYSTCKHLVKYRQVTCGRGS